MKNVSFSTTDIVLAAYLVTKRYRILSIDKIGNKGTFIFDEVDPSIITQYDTGSGLVEPVAFNNAIKQLTTAVRRQL